MREHLRGSPTAAAPARGLATGRTIVAAVVAAVMASLVIALAGCATVPAPAPPVTRPAPPAAARPVTPPDGPPPGVQVGSTASGGRITLNETPMPVPAVVDSSPSEDALAVLRTIPEPSGTSELPDTVRVPVPSPTQALGDRPGARPIPTLPESLAAPSALPPIVSPPPPAVAPPAVPASSPDSCWRVQVAAPPERDRAERMAEVARSQLLLPFVIEPEGGLLKVRTRGCLSAAAASDLRRRAVESGFAGAFRFMAKGR